jgi:hypothetical protein
MRFLSVSSYTIGSGAGSKSAIPHSAHGLCICYIPRSISTLYAPPSLSYTIGMHALHGPCLFFSVLDHSPSPNDVFGIYRDDIWLVSGMYNMLIEESLLALITVLQLQTCLYIRGGFSSVANCSRLFSFRLPYHRPY